MRTLAHVVLGQTNKNTEGQFIYFLLFHYTPQAHHRSLCGNSVELPTAKTEVEAVFLQRLLHKRLLDSSPLKNSHHGCERF